MASLWASFMQWCFPPERFPQEFEEAYERGDVLGRGGYSVVYKVTEKAGEKRTFAAKVLDLEKFTKESALEELSVLQEMAQIRNVIRYITHFEEEGCNKLVIILTLAKGSDLADIVVAQPLGEELAKDIAYQLLRILEQCQDELSMVNGDIKLENTMVDLANPESPVVTLIDLGSAQKAGKPVKGYTGSYVAPEAMGAGVKAAYSADMFSVGIYVLKLLTRGAPVKWNFPGPTLDFSKFAGSADAKDLVKSLATYDVGARLTVKQALSHQWFDSCRRDTSLSSLSGISLEGL